MKLYVVVLFALYVSLGSAEDIVGGWSELEKPPFARDDRAVTLITELDKELRPLLAAKVPDDPAIRTANITVTAYRQHLVNGINYETQIEVTKRYFVARIHSPFRGSPKIENVVGPLLPDSSTLLAKP